jgi:RimJ/RimL family protein N-acetyltransferase
MREDFARAICSWRYPEPYSVYDGSPRNLAYLLDPGNRYYAAVDAVGDLVGFFCFGADARVPGELSEEESGDSEILDVGLGMRPDLTGQGRGSGFVSAGLSFARYAFAPKMFRLAVMTFNRRAMRVYEDVGFRPVKVFTVEIDGVKREFLMMICVERSSDGPR